MTISVPEILFTEIVIDWVSEHPDGFVIWTPIMAPLNKFKVVLAEKNKLPETAAASTGTPDI